MKANELFNNDFTPAHILEEEATSELERIADQILQDRNVFTLSVPSFENLEDRDELRTAIWRANTQLNFNSTITPHYLPPFSYFDLGGMALKEGKEHPLYIFEEMGYFQNATLFEYKLVLGQLIESIERIASKGTMVMKRKSSILDLKRIPEDVANENQQVKMMRNSEQGKSLMEENEVSKYHPLLRILSKFSPKLKLTYDKSKEGLSRSWPKYKEHLQNESDASFDQFMQDYAGDLERATECMKLSYVMTKELLSKVTNENSLKNIPATVDMALYPHKYEQARDIGIKHLENIDHILSAYIVHQL